MTCLSTINVNYDCKRINYNSNLYLYFHNKKGAKQFKLLAKQYIITGIEIAGINGYFDTDGHWFENFTVFGNDYFEHVIRPSEPQYKILYEDYAGNKFYWLLNSDEIDIHN